MSNSKAPSDDKSTSTSSTTATMRESQSYNQPKPAEQIIAQPETSVISLSTGPASNPRIEALSSKQARLQVKVAELQQERSTLASQSTGESTLAQPSNGDEQEQVREALASANKVIKDHIALLHQYNELKDMGQGLVGLIAEDRGTRVTNVMDDLGIDERD